MQIVAQVDQFRYHLHLQYNILIELNVPWKQINKELKLYNYDHKKIKLPLNLYSQHLVHNIASTFLGKRRDRYGVRIFFLELKIVA